MSRLAACLRLASIPVVAAACKLTTMPRATQVVAGVVSLSPDAREYDKPSHRSPPPTAILTLDNATSDNVTVRRCLVGAGSQDPIGADLTLQRQDKNGAWQDVDVHPNCREPGLPRADLAVAPSGQAVVARLVLKDVGRYRARLGYGVGSDAEPSDTVTSETFVVR